MTNPKFTRLGPGCLALQRTPSTGSSATPFSDPIGTITDGNLILQQNADPFGPHRQSWLKIDQRPQSA